MSIQSYRDLEVWCLAMDIAQAVYALTATFPTAERYGITAQLQRSAVSIPSNIAEGHERDSTRDFLRFLSIAQGSLAELETQLLLAVRLNLADEAKVQSMFAECRRLGRMMSGLQSRLRERLAFDGSPAPGPRPPAPVSSTHA
jgi:four helix bundle protein